MIMQKKSNVFIIVSFSVMIITCIGIMSVFVMSMTNKSEKAISEISALYMEDISSEVARHFQTNIDLRLNQVETIIENIPEKSVEYGDEMIRSLQAGGKARNFDFLALLNTEGELETVYGEDMTLVGKESFLKSLNRGKKKVALAQNMSGEDYILFGVSVDYPMADQKKSTALVAGIQAEYFNKLFLLDGSEDSMTFSNVIRENGDYVIKNYDDDVDNYFERVQKLFEDLNGKDGKQYVSEIRNAMKHGQDYSTAFLLGEERRHLFCTPLPNSDWYLLTIMPYGEIEEVVSDLNGQRMTMLVGSTILVISIFMLIFFLYYRRTRRQIMELELARSEAVEANQAKSEFLSNMSHDIRTPMNAIVGMTTIAMENIDNKKQLQHCLKKISQSNKQLLGLINDILDMSKIESGKMSLNMELVSFRELLDDLVTVVQPQIKAKDQEFEILVSNIIAENVYSDSVRLHQVIMNLLSNAVKFTPQKGKILLNLYEEPSSEGEDFVRVHIIVEDSGIGMSEEFQKKIFDSFAREDNRRVHKTEGTGLGMAITKYIVDTMNGTIEVDSQQGRGTKFHIVIDMERGVGTEEEMTLPPWNVLVVDDDEMMCKNAVTFLREMGMQPDWAFDGETALAMIQEHYKKHGKYQAILIDWKLPGMDGMETAGEVRKKVGDDVVIILVSAYDWGDFEEKAGAAGISAYLPKPVFKSSLFHMLKQFADGEVKTVQQKKQWERDFSGVRMLVAEDNDLNWEIAQELFSKQGFLLEHAENGRECVEMFQASPEGFYSLILMDIRMPVMTGLEATEEIRQQERSDAGLPIIAMTADAFSEDIRKCMECGMDAHVSKPINLKEVLDVIESYL